MENNSLYEETVNITIIKSYNSPDFSRQLISTIEKAKQLDSRISKQPQTIDLISFLDKYQRQYSKNKINWIIPEPDSKYTNNEIPNIYIP
ncbi:hypothetical protein [Sphingobacterium siyangense]|uniref:hypothetical protein n=1 Tax=Sphingobacterium siyangense TaxID=459529 RepID=UPI003DA5C040